MLICTIAIRSPAGRRRPARETARRLATAAHRRDGARGEAGGVTRTRPPLLGGAEGREKGPGRGRGRRLLVLHLALQPRDEPGNRRVGPEGLAQALLDQAPHPGEGLAPPLGRKLAGGLEGVLVGTHRGPDLRDALAGASAHAEHRRAPAGAAHAQELESVAVLRLCALGRCAALAIRLVHHKQARKFDYALLDALEF